jgi:hypothetical protein
LARLAFCFVACSLSLGLAASAQAAPVARIQDLRHGQQDGYDRLVIELSAPCDVLQRPPTADHDLIVDLAARPQQLRQEIGTGLARIGTVVIAETAQGARIESPRLDRKIRLFRVSDPPRLVIDFADTTGIELNQPTGNAAVALLPEGEPLIGSEQAPRRAQRAEGERSLSESAEATAVPAHDAPGAVELDPEASLLQEPPGAVTSAPRPAESLSPTRLGLYTAPLLLLLLGLAAAAAHLSHQTWRRLHAPEYPALQAATRRSREPAAAPVRPSAPGAPADRTDLLERRHDEEVRARMDLEERVMHMQDELRLLRQRLKL